MIELAYCAQKYFFIIYKKTRLQSMPVIYIRHGNDEEHKPKYKNDPQLVKESLSDITELTEYLIKKHGMPDIVCVSPMSRAIETCQHMEKHFRKTKIRVCPDLSRFFTSCESTHLAPRTFNLRVPLRESKRKFTERVYNHVDLFFQKGFYQHRRPIVWCITHALVMKRVANRLNKRLRNHLEFLDHFVVGPF